MSGDGAAPRACPGGNVPGALGSPAPDPAAPGRSGPHPAPADTAPAPAPAPPHGAGREPAPSAGCGAGKGAKLMPNRPAHLELAGRVHASYDVGLFISDDHKGERLRAHAAAVSQLRTLLNYEFPCAVGQCTEWSEGIRRVASAPSLPTPPEVPAYLQLPMPRGSPSAAVVASRRRVVAARPDLRPMSPAHSTGIPSPTFTSAGKTSLSQGFPPSSPPCVPHVGKLLPCASTGSSWATCSSPGATSSQGGRAGTSQRSSSGRMQQQQQQRHGGSSPPLPTSPPGFGPQIFA